MVSLRMNSTFVLFRQFEHANFRFHARDFNFDIADDAFMYH